MHKSYIAYSFCCRLHLWNVELSQTLFKSLISVVYFVTPSLFHLALYMSDKSKYKLLLLLLAQ